MPTKQPDLCIHGRDAEDCYYNGGECWAERTAAAISDLADTKPDLAIHLGPNGWYVDPLPMTEIRQRHHAMLDTANRLAGEWSAVWNTEASVWEFEPDAHIDEVLGFVARAEAEGMEVAWR